MSALHDEVGENKKKVFQLRARNRKLTCVPANWMHETEQRLARLLQRLTALEFWSGQEAEDKRKKNYQSGAKCNPAHRELASAPALCIRSTE